MKFGAGRGQKGVVVVLTFGTGIGSAVFVNGQLVPNTELGHIELRGKDAERCVSDRARQEKDLDWKKWAGRVNEYLGRIKSLFSPDLIIVGGGVSKRHEKFLPMLTTRASRPGSVAQRRRHRRRGSGGQGSRVEAVRRSFWQSHQRETTAGRRKPSAAVVRESPS